MENVNVLENLTVTPESQFNSRVLTRRTRLYLPPNVSLHEWKRFGKQLFLISDSSCWWLGDWLVYGQEQYPDRYRRAMEETGLDYKTLRNYAWVVRRYAVSERHPKVSFQHHAEVASLEPAERARWLERAAHEGWSRNMLRRQVRQTVAAPQEDSRERVLLQMHVSSEHWGNWTSAAERNGRDLTEWIVLCLDQAAALESTSGG
ncbi:LmbU family transcriptional regulator [Streptomyces sp. NPDC057092]|uniref:LmbU family transcriptional regulator n=1 Tax=Streptomyces sp. NPDC057092 TaxID=3346017 RepID=UPI00363626B6